MIRIDPHTTVLSAAGRESSLPSRRVGAIAPKSSTMDTGSSTTKSDAEEGKALGQAINSAVLQEISRQQRPGGLLAATAGSG